MGYPYPCFAYVLFGAPVSLFAAEGLGFVVLVLWYSGMGLVRVSGLGFRV